MVNSLQGSVVNSLQGSEKKGHGITILNFGRKEEPLWKQVIIGKFGKERGVSALVWLGKVTK